MADRTPSEVLAEDSIKEVLSISVSVEPHPVTGTPNTVVVPVEDNLRRGLDRSVGRDYNLR